MKTRFVLFRFITGLLVLVHAAWAGPEPLIDFTRARGYGLDYSIGTGVYLPQYRAEQCVLDANGITVYSDPGKQTDPEAGWFTMSLYASLGAQTNWYNRDFELVLAGAPRGRDGSDIALNLTDATGEVFQYTPSNQYTEDGDVHFVFRNSNNRPASTHWGGDKDGVITPPMAFTHINVHFHGIAATVGEITFNRVVPLSGDETPRTTGVVEPISLDTTFPGAPPFVGPDRMVFSAKPAYTGGVILYLYEESDHYASYGKSTNLYARMENGTVVFNTPLDPTRHYHFNRLDIASGYTVTNATAYIRQSAAEAMRLDVDTGNALHLCRDVTERPVLVISNPATNALHWQTTFVLTDSFAREIRIPFDETVAAGATRRLEVPWPLPAKGVWYVAARVTGDDGSVERKTTQFAYIARHTATPCLAKPTFRFGIHNHGSYYLPDQLDTVVDALVAAGAKFTRTDYSFMFSAICPTEAIYNRGPDHWSWSKADLLIDKYRNAGLATEIIIYGAPAWAQDPTATWNQTPEGRAGGRSGCRPMKKGIFQNFCEHFGRRYAGKIDYYEVGNEWDIVPRVTLSHEEGLRMQREAYDGLHAGDTNACVCPNGWASVGVSYNEANYRDPNYNWGLSECISDNPDTFDAWLIHVHSTFESYADRIDTYLMPLIHGKLQNTRPWVSGESAVTSAYGNEPSQGAHVWYKTLFAWNRGARDYIWYNLRATGWFDGGEPGFGLMSADFHPRAGYAAFAAITDIFEGLAADGTVYEHGNRKLFRYRGTNLKGTIDGIVLAGWDRGREDEWLFQIATDATRAELSDHMGNRTEMPIRDGVVDFAGAFYPRALILHGASFARAANACLQTTPVADAFTNRHWFVDAANPVPGDGSASNPFNTLQTALDAAAPWDTVELAAGDYTLGARQDAVYGLSRAELDRPLRLIGAGRDKTRLRGGAATRCLLLRPSAAGSLLEGLSFLDGETAPLDLAATTDRAHSNIRTESGGTTYRLARTGGNVAACGGGLYYLATNRYELVYLVDCHLGNCRAGYAGGAAYGPLSLIRTRVDTSWAEADHGGALAHVAGGYSCVFAGNGHRAKSVRDTVHAAPETTAGNHVEGVFVNCTMTGNLGGGLPFHSDDACTNYDAARGFAFYNCVFYPFSQARYVTGSIDCHNCCQSYYGSMKQQATYKTDGFNAFGNIGGDGYPRLAEDNLPFGRDQFVSGYGDWHLRAGSALLDVGSNAWISAQAARFVPQEYLGTDFYGNARIQDGTVDMGAAEGAFPTGCVYTVSGEYPFTANGFPVYGDFGGLRVSGLPGADLALSFDLGGAPLYGVSTTNLLMNACRDYYRKQINFRRYYPDFRDTTVHLRVEDPATADRVTLTAIGASAQKWVSPDGDDTNPGSESQPYRTLAKAVSALPKYGVLLAKPGCYAEGRMEATTDPDWPRSTSNRVTIVRDMRLVGVEGAAKTFILGAPASGTGFVNEGCGAGALRCVGVSAGVFAQVQGFTLTGGHTDSDPIGKAYAYQKALDKTIKTGDDLNAYNWAGGAFVGDSYAVGRVMATVADCIISNNVAYRYAALCGGTAVRCLITENTTVDSAAETNDTRRIGGAVGMAGLDSCIVCNNDGVAGAVVSAPPDVGRIYHGVLSEAGAHAVCGSDNHVYNSLFVRCAQIPAYVGGGNITNPPCAHTARGLFRIAAGSPAATAGRVENDDPWHYAWYHAGLDGAWPALTVPDGTLPAGPYHDLGRIGLRNAETNTYDEVYPVEGRTTVSLQAHDADRRCVGYVWQGVTNASDRAFTLTCDGTYTSPFLPFGALPAATPVYARDWYADAVNGDDNADGTSRATAKRTLQAALDLAAPGETVYAAPGEYAAGATLHATNGWINPKVAVTNATRAVVGEGVSLVALGSREETIIRGYRDPDSPSYPWYKSLGFGFSAASIRGVALARNALLRGFTVTDCSLDVSAVNNITDNQCGAGILCQDESARVEDCTLTLCDAGYGGGAWGGTLDRCRIVDCYAVSSGGAAAEGTYRNCFFDRAADKMIYNAHALENCTFGPNNRYFQGSSGTRSSRILSGAAPTNCLVLAVVEAKHTNTYTHAHHTVFAYLNDPGQVALRSGSGNLVKPYAELLAQYDTARDYAPYAGAASIDRGDNAASAAQGPYDVAGRMRVLNGTVDAGAHEYDGALAEPFRVTQEGGARRQEADGSLYFAGGGRYTLWNDTAFTVTDDMILEPDAQVIISNGTLKGTVRVVNGPYDLTAYMRGLSNRSRNGLVTLKPELDPANETVIESVEPRALEATDVSFGVSLPAAIPGLWYSLLGAETPAFEESVVDDCQQATGPVRLESPVRDAKARFFRARVTATP